MSRSYDYIIAGAGSTGCVIANRITEDPDVNLLLLEFSWRNNSPRLKIPAPFIYNYTTSSRSLQL